VLAIGRVSLVQLVVAGAEDVDVLLGVDAVLEQALGGGCVVKPVALNAVARIDEDDVDALVIGAGPQVVGEGDVIAPVSRVLRPGKSASASGARGWREK
jgi:hypothetical protein